MPLRNVLVVNGGVPLREYKLKGKCYLNIQSIKTGTLVGGKLMVNYIRLMEDVNKVFRERFGALANPRDYPVSLQQIIEDCTDMLEEEANDHNGPRVNEDES